MDLADHDIGIEACDEVPDDSHRLRASLCRVCPWVHHLDALLELLLIVVPLELILPLTVSPSKHPVIYSALHPCLGEVAGIYGVSISSGCC